MPKLDEQISTLQERLKQLKVRQQRIDVRKRALEMQRERKAETRRQILVGTLVMAMAESGELDPDQLRGWLESGLTRAADRVLFDLPPLDAGPESTLGSSPQTSAIHTSAVQRDV
jgi:outer membrane PBP1 activator LpoA protein